jgi:single-strand DNA-binding protein
MSSINSLNKCILIGNVGKDPEIKNFANGGRVVTFSLATTQSYKDKDENWQNITEWHKIAIYNENLINKIISYSVTKGFLLYIEGVIKTKQYTDSNNVVKYTTEIVLSNYDGTFKILKTPNFNVDQAAKQEIVSDDIPTDW